MWWRWRVRWSAECRECRRAGGVPAVEVGGNKRPLSLDHPQEFGGRVCVVYVVCVICVMRAGPHDGDFHMPFPYTGWRMHKGVLHVQGRTPRFAMRARARGV
jgi:hypothetical protein